MSRADIQTNVRLKAEIVERLKFHAADTGVSLTEMLNRILEVSVPDIPRGVVRSQIRLPGDLHVKLQVAAKEAGRSFNSEMVKRLEATFL